MKYKQIWTCDICEDEMNDSEYYIVKKVTDTTRFPFNNIICEKCWKYLISTEGWRNNP